MVDVKDNLGIKSISVKVSGGASFSLDTTFKSAHTDASLPFAVSVPRSVPRGTPVLVLASSVDGALNHSAVDTLRLTVGNVPPATVHFTSPANGTIAVVGKSVIVSVSARSAVKVKSVGFRTSGSFVVADSAVFSSPLGDSVSVLDTIPIPANAPTGALSVAPFVIDSLGQRTVGPVLVLNVQPLSAVNSVPVVSFSHSTRMEVGDTLHVEATDQAGITVLGYEVRRTVAGVIDAKDSSVSNGNITSQLRTFALKLPYSEFPTLIYIQAFARNSNGVRAYAKLSGGADRVDTVTVVAGSTRAMGDTLLVANSGATDISYVNLNGAGSGREVFRYALPNIIAFTVTSTKTAAGFILQQRTKYDFSDRPQFIGSTCTGTGTSCGDVIVTYSTTPTPGQSEPFNKNNGTLRWENLTKGTSHLFFEQAEGQSVDAQHWS